MTDRRADMMRTLADIRSKPDTPGRRAAAARIEAGLAKMDAYAARAQRGSSPRAVSPIDREELMKLADSPSASFQTRQRARRILDGSDMSGADASFLDRAMGREK